tara:strand:- start:3696 stop:4325 length:630 start_codon:yes stop_codon:yes gene_type:complete
MRSIIYGAGSYGHELAEYICDVFGKSLDEKDFIKFLDDDPNKTKSENNAWEVVGSVENFKFCDGDSIYIGLGNPTHRDKAYRSLKKQGLEIKTLIHPTAYISRDSEISEGCVIGPFSTVGYKARLEKNVMLNSYVAIGHHAIVGDSSVVSPKSLVAGGAEVGKCCFIGSGSVITPSKKIGDFVSVGAGAVIYRNVKDKAKVFGNPAKKI